MQEDHQSFITSFPVTGALVVKVTPNCRSPICIGSRPTTPPTLKALFSDFISQILLFSKIIQQWIRRHSTATPAAYLNYSVSINCLQIWQRCCFIPLDTLKPI
jgi:hypothetical protein